MNKAGRVIFLLSLLLAVSCSTGRHLARVGHSPEFAMNMYTPLRNYTVLQVYDSNFCLAMDDASVQPSVIAITLSDREGPVYEGQKVKGLYVMIDTYTYETKGGVSKTGSSCHLSNIRFSSSPLSFCPSFRFLKHPVGVLDVLEIPYGGE